MQVVGQRIIDRLDRRIGEQFFVGAVGSGDVQRRRGAPGLFDVARGDRILLSVYVLAGLIAAIAGWVLIGRIGAISPTAGANGNLDSVTASKP